MYFAVDGLRARSPDTNPLEWGNTPGPRPELSQNRACPKRGQDGRDRSPIPLDLAARRQRRPGQGQWAPTLSPGGDAPGESRKLGKTGLRPLRLTPSPKSYHRHAPSADHPTRGRAGRHGRCGPIFAAPLPRAKRLRCARSTCARTQTKATRPGSYSYWAQLLGPGTGSPKTPPAPGANPGHDGRPQGTRSLGLSRATQGLDAGTTNSGSTKRARAFAHARRPMRPSTRQPSKQQPRAVAPLKSDVVGEWGYLARPDTKMTRRVKERREGKDDTVGSRKAPPPCKRIAQEVGQAGQVARAASKASTTRAATTSYRRLTPNDDSRSPQRYPRRTRAPHRAHHKRAGDARTRPASPGAGAAVACGLHGRFQKNRPFTSTGTAR